MEIHVPLEFWSFNAKCLGSCSLNLGIVPDLSNASPSGQLPESLHHI